MMLKKKNFDFFFSIIKDNQVNNCISKGTFELLSNIKPEFSITNLTKSLDEIIRGKFSID